MVAALAFALANAIALRHSPRPLRAVRRSPALGDGRVDGGRLARVSLVMNSCRARRMARGRTRRSGSRAAVRHGGHRLQPDAASHASLACTRPATAQRSDSRQAFALRPAAGDVAVPGHGLRRPPDDAVVYQVVPTYLESRGMSRAWISSAMTLGQLPEIVVLAALPWLIGRVGTERRRWRSASGRGWCGTAAWPSTPRSGWRWPVFRFKGWRSPVSRSPARFTPTARRTRDRRASARRLYMVVTAGLGSSLGMLAGGDRGRARAGRPRVVLPRPLRDRFGTDSLFLCGFPTQRHDRRMRRCLERAHPCEERRRAGDGGPRWATS